MKQYYFFGLAAVILSVALYFLFAGHGAAPAQTATSTPTTTQLPTSGNVVPVVTGDSGTGTSKGSMTVAARGGGTPIAVADFIHDGAATPNAANPGYYQLTNANQSTYSIGYDSQTQLFTIALEQEPLGAARSAAEQFLMSVLGISETQMCDLKYYLSTDDYTNSFYAGKNLGFSFCPQATALPQ